MCCTTRSRNRRITDRASVRIRSRSRNIRSRSSSSSMISISRSRSCRSIRSRVASRRNRHIRGSNELAFARLSVTRMRVSRECARQGVCRMLDARTKVARTIG